MPDDIIFGDPEAPHPPPEDLRVTDYRVMPWPDGTRVTVEMGLTQFRVFPAMDISIATPDGEVLRPLESQAGTRTLARGVSVRAWWASSRFQSFAFWRHP